MTVSAPREASLGRRLADLPELVERPSEPLADGTAARVTPRLVDDRVDPRSLLVSHQRWALVGDFSAALVAGFAAMGVRFGVTPHPAYLALSLVIPFVWVLAIFAQRGYERRYLGTGPEEYRRVADAGLLLFAGIAVVGVRLPR